ncbi:MAG: MazG nucleotide pyrophosphohydrolase domain-containing protein [Anaerolineae bacterium]|nr:MazG nucleotide pyrophosphohydrolase domain-containing protein [Anaerolineae bacterium]
MHISEYQRWLEEWDRQRGWHRVSPSHTLIHALEEMGEVARLVLHLEGYKGGESLEAVRAELATELSDLFVFLFKLAYQCGIDMEEALKAGQAKADERWGDLAAARAELERYLARQAGNLAHLQGDSPASSSDP